MAIAPIMHDTSCDPALALEAWLAAQVSPNTRRAYRAAWDNWMAFVGKSAWQVSRSDVTAWIQRMQDAGASPATTAQRLAAVSSFYTYCSTSFMLDLPNPVMGVCRPRSSPYGQSSYLNAEQLRTLLTMIPRHSTQGLRDYALILTHLATGRLSADITALKWQDLLEENEHVVCQWADRQDELPGRVYVAICDYLEFASRLAHMRSEDFIFTPLTNRASRLPNVRDWDRNRPLSSREVGRLLKRHARRAGLPAQQISARTLRYSAVMLRREVGDDPSAVCDFLAHSHLSTTTSLLRNLESRQALAWASIEEMLGLSQVQSLRTARAMNQGTRCALEAEQGH